MPQISVIIVNYNAGKHLARCLETLAQQRFRDFDVWLVDNASTDGSIEALPVTLNSAFPNGFHLIKSQENLGFAGGNNRAAQEACGTWIATLNPDAFPKPNWLEKLVAATNAFPEVTMFGSVQIDAQNPAQLDGAGDMYHILGIPARSYYKQPVTNLATGDVFAPCAAAALYRRDTFARVGGFDERFFCYCEDVDLAFRLRLLGERCIQVSDAIVEHIGQGTGSTGDFTLYHGMRNRFWCFIKNMPPLLFWPLLPIHVMLQCLFLLRAVIKGQGAVAFRALMDGIKGLPLIWRERQRIQKQRNVSMLKLLGTFTYSPWALMTRKG
ncbi:MAG: putative glycosyltransferase [Rickettsiales bacterium]|jgi:GT2 family glycosyltransferase|nr:putative glycosyltransferase [Rickettsiales bacterium]